MPLEDEFLSDGGKILWKGLRDSRGFHLLRIPYKELPPFYSELKCNRYGRRTSPHGTITPIKSKSTRIITDSRKNIPGASYHPYGNMSGFARAEENVPSDVEFEIEEQTERKGNSVCESLRFKEVKEWQCNEGGRRGWKLKN